MAEAQISDVSDEDYDDDYEEYDLSYDMCSSPKGICFIINNKIFYKGGPQSKLLDRRDGTDADRDALKRTYEGLDFEVELSDDLTDTGMIHAMYEMAQRNHTKFKCFVCCILSHGSLGNVYGCNGVPVKISDLTSPLKPQVCPSLTDKPKVFIIQACQGSEDQRGYRAPQSDTLPTSEELIPNESDFLLAFSTVPGFRAFRDPQNGSTFIQKFAKTLSTHPEMDIHEILTKVNYAVGRKNNKIRGDSHRFKQSPAPLYSLRKKLSFGPGMQAASPPDTVRSRGVVADNARHPSPPPRPGKMESGMMDSPNYQNYPRASRRRPLSPPPRPPRTPSSDPRTPPALPPRTYLRPDRGNEEGQGEDGAPEDAKIGYRSLHHERERNSPREDAYPAHRHKFPDKISIANLSSSDDSCDEYGDTLLTITNFVANASESDSDSF